MSATLQLISTRVGEGGAKSGNSVRRVQELLVAAGEALPKFGADGGWGDEAETALASFLKKNHKPTRKYVAADDELLLLMAAEADILVQLPGVGGSTGVKALHRTFCSMNTKYNDGAQHGAGNRALYGVEGESQWAIQTFWDDAAKRTTIRKGPVEMDCTTYVNLMLSVYLFGNAHNNKYEASCKDYGWGSNKHCARDRYGLPLVERVDTSGGKSMTVRYFRSAEEIKAATKSNPASFYVLEVAGTGWDKEKKEKVYGVVTHMAFLLESEVYECTTNQVGCACIKRSLDDFMATKGGIIYLFGPAPTGA
jgi:hypothetical protein